MKKKVITIGGIAIAVSIIGTEISVNEEGNKMNTYSFIYTINKEFWKKEKSLLILYELSLWLVILSILFHKGDSFFDYSLVSIIKNGEFGILQGTILLGFGLLWHHSLEERRQDFIVQRMLGTRTRDICLGLQMELLFFQVFTIIWTLIYFAIYSVLIESPDFKLLVFGFFRIQLELQLLFGILGGIFTKNLIKTQS